MKTLKMLVFAVVVSMLTACAPALQIGVGTIGNSIGKGLSEKYNSPNLVLMNEIENHKVGDSHVIICEGSYKSRPGIIFFATKAGRMTGNLRFYKNDPGDMKMLGEFNQMSQSEKKRFIKEKFLEISKIDLGPLEVAKDEPPANELSDTKPLKTSPSPTYSVPSAGFAPRIR